MKFVSWFVFIFPKFTVDAATALVPPARITVYFVRHANSIWNEATDVFSGQDDGRPKSALQKAKALATGALKTVVGFAKRNFRDAQLSEEGKRQARELANWLESQCPADRSLVLADGRPWNPDACVLNRPDPEVTLLASNLKRTHETLILGLSNRLHQGLPVAEAEAAPTAAASSEDSRPPKKYEIINILRDLQELGCKTDARPRDHDRLNLLPSPAICSCRFNTKTLDRDPLFRKRPMTQTELMEQNEMLDTCEPTRRDERERFSSVIKSLFMMHKYHHKNIFVIVGHSHWIQHFFRAKLIFNVADDSVGAFLKSKKIPNTGVIKFDLIAKQDEVGNIDTRAAVIDPDTPEWVYRPNVEEEDEGGDEEEEEDVEEERLDHIAEREPLVI